MKFCILASALCALTTAGFAGLSGLYTIDPINGDFPSLRDAGEAIQGYGLSGNCVFEIYGETLFVAFTAAGVAGSDLWTTTFRPGPGEDPVLTYYQGPFQASYYDNVKIESLRFDEDAVIITANCSGWRISGCRFDTHDATSLVLQAGMSDTVDGNTFNIRRSGSAALGALGGEGNAIFNNFLNIDSGSAEVLVGLDHERNTLFAFNTLRQSPREADYGNCLVLSGESPCEVRSNLFVLARPADTVNACVGIYEAVPDSIVLDGNCYFVESLGYVGVRDTSGHPIWYEWDEWRGIGYEVNGISADPMLVSATDLHLRQGSPCIGAAVPIPGLEFDIDGDPRDAAHPDIGADEFTGGGIEETPNAERRTANTAPTIVRGILPVPAANGEGRKATGVLVDAMGRKVLDLHPDANDVRALAPGVYFVRDEGRGARDVGPMHKVVIQR